MAYLEELLPEFRKGAKIRRKNWPENLCISLRGSCGINIAFYDVNADDWEKVPDNPIDWDYIIKNKCLCLFWDYNESKKHIGILKSINKYETYKFSIVTPDNYVSDISFVNCRPVRRDEVTFYEDKKDEQD